MGRASPSHMSELSVGPLLAQPGLQLPQLSDILLTNHTVGILGLLVLLSGLIYHFISQHDQPHQSHHKKHSKSYTKAVERTEGDYYDFQASYLVSNEQYRYEGQHLTALELAKLAPLLEDFYNK